MSGKGCQAEHKGKRRDKGYQRNQEQGQRRRAVQIFIGKEAGFEKGMVGTHIKGMEYLCACQYHKSHGTSGLYRAGFVPAEPEAE